MTPDKEWGDNRSTPRPAEQAGVKAIPHARFEALTEPINQTQNGREAALCV